MRLTEEQVKQGILHSDPQVRFAAMNYFAQAFSRDTTVMPVVIEAFERFGRSDAFPFTFKIAELAQTPETIEWAISVLQGTDDKTEGSRDLKHHLGQLLCNADLELVLPQEAKILEVLAFEPESRQRFSRLSDIHGWDDETCWRELEALCEAGKDKEYAHEARFPEAEEIAQSLARRGERHADRMMALLAEKIDDFENNPMRWMEPLMVYLAGEMRHEPATPLIIGKLHEDGEVLDEECMYALVKIGTDPVIRGIGEAFPTAPWHFRLYAASVFGRIHSELAVETCSTLLEDEETGIIRLYLATSLAEQFSSEANELARKVLLEGYAWSGDLRETLVASCTLLEQDFPELAEWRQDGNRSRQRRQNWGRTTSETVSDAPEGEMKLRFDDGRPRPAPVRSQKGLGRNDPCPCGSGKKYKQCCMRKQSVL